MTGTSVSRIRGLSLLSPSLFAQLVGVHQSTVYAWEKKADADLSMEPHQDRILSVLDEQLLARGAVLAEELRRALLARGGLYALYRLLHAAYGEGVRAPSRAQA